MLDSGEIPKLRERITGRSLFFEGQNGIALAMQVDIPINDVLRFHLINDEQIKIPKNIKTLSIIDFALEENIPFSQRIINNDKKDFSVATLVKSVEETNNFDKDLGKGPYTISKIHQMIRDLGISEENRTILNSQLDKDSSSDSLIIVSGHAVEAEEKHKLVIGEKKNTVVKQKQGEIKISTGNSVLVQHVIDYLNRKTQAGAIFLNACSGEDVDISTNRIPVVYSRDNEVGIHTRPEKSAIALPKKI